MENREDNSMDVAVQRVTRELAEVSGGLTPSKRSAYSLPILRMSLVREEPEIHQPKLRRQVLRRVYNVKHNFHAQLDLVAVESQLNQLYENMLSPAIANCHPNDLISVTLNHEELDRGQFYIEHTKKKDITFHELTHAINTLSQSNTTFLLDGNLELKVSIIKPLKGGSDENQASVSPGCYVKARGATKPAQSLEDYFKKSQSLVNIKGSSTACGYQALGLGMFRAMGDITRDEFKLQWKNLVRSSNCQQDLIQDMLVKYDTDVDCGMEMDTEEMTRIQDAIRLDFKIYVFQRPSAIPCRDMLPLFEGKSRSTRHVYLEYVPGKTLDSGHYNLITKLPGYMGVKEICLVCYKGSDKSGRHQCEAICGSCGRKNCEVLDEFECDVCAMTCRSELCLDIHLEKKCAKKELCRECEVRYAPHEKYVHRCDHKYCAQCDMEYGSNHHHFITPLEKHKLMEQDQKHKIIIAYDIEAAQIKIDERYSEHRANLLISHTICDICWKWDEMDSIDCEQCGPKERTFQGEACVEQFCEYLIKEVSPRASKESLVDIYAHNAKAYDSRFILREMLERQMKRHELIMTGSKITKMMVGNLRFLDSCLHFQQKLSKLPASFNFADRVVKGFFPHLFNDGTNWNYAGPVPDAKYFGIDTMQEDDRKNFELWYSERSADPTPWVFAEEIVIYCRNDVEVLLLAIQKYRRQTIEETDIDPTTRKFTLAGVAHETWRASMLEKGAIGITPISGYSDRKCSMIGKAWIDGEELRLGIQIEREVGLGPYYADGFHRESRTVYEFWGCLWHGCECQYVTEDKTFEIGGKLMKGAELRAKVQEKVDYYGRRGFEVVQIKECELLDKLYPLSRNVAEENRETDYEVYKFTNFIRDRLAYYRKLKKDNLGCDIRESFYGGRTGNCALYYECKEDEELRYLDFTSLYPDVLKNREYPLSHPEVLAGHSDREDELLARVDNREVFGFVSCTILPPKRRMFGILPVRNEGKLLFPLCALCGMTENKSECRHEDEERMLTGTWCTAELYAAMDNRYRLVTVHEALHYEKTSDELFKAYIDKWLRIKQEASGWPGWVQKEQARGKAIAKAAEDEFVQRMARVNMTREEIIRGLGWPPIVKVKQEEGAAIARAAEDKYIADYLANEGIQLNRESISKNPGRRSIAKLMLNSFYGKFAQRPNLPKTKIVNTYAEFMKIFDDEKLQIVGEHDTGLESLIINYIYKDANNCPPGNTSIAVASFVTAYARLKLYDLIETVENELPLLRYKPRTLYFDTDSIIFIAHKDDPKNGDSPVRTGDYLGMLTDEIKDGYGDSAICKRAAFLGPKNYAYEISYTDKPGKKNVVKCKGVTLYSSDLNAFKEFETVIEMAKTAHNERQHQAKTFPQFAIRADVDTHVLSTVTFEKTISSNMNKRRYLPRLGWSVPLGFQLPWLTDEGVRRILGDDGTFDHYMMYFNCDRSFEPNNNAEQENKTRYPD